MATLTLKFTFKSNDLRLGRCKGIKKYQNNTFLY